MQQFPGALAGAVLAATLTGSAAFGGGPEPGNLTLSEVVPASTAIPSTVELMVGFAHLLRIEGNVSTIMLGDPNIADANPLDSGAILLNGRAAGITNMIVLDERGGVLADLMLRVSARRPGAVTVRRALDTQVYSCATELCQGASPQDPSGTAPAAAPALESASQ